MNKKKFISYLKHNGFKVIDKDKEIFIGTNNPANITNVGVTYNYITHKIFIEEFRDISIEDLLNICIVIDEYNHVEQFFDTEGVTEKFKNPLSIFMCKKNKYEEYEQEFQKFVLELECCNNKYRESNIKLIDGLFIDTRGLSIKNKIKFQIKKSEEIDDKTKEIYVTLAEKKCK